MSDKSNYSKTNTTHHTPTSTTTLRPEMQQHMNYLGATTRTSQQKPNNINNGNINGTTQHSTTQPKAVITPHHGLGGGLTEIDKKVLKMESDMILLKQITARTTESVLKMESEVKSQITGIEDKIDNTSCSLIEQMDKKIQSNNQILESKLSQTVEEKLSKNNTNNNVSL
jgi:hypothetical protein